MSSIYRFHWHVHPYVVGIAYLHLMYDFTYMQRMHASHGCNTALSWKANS